MAIDQSGMQGRLLKMQFGRKVRARVYRKISAFLKNGVSLPDTLRALQRFATDDGRKPKDPQAMVLKEWADRVGNGQSFGRAVTGWVPPADRIVIEAGEAAGGLATALDNALYIQESGRKIRTAIISGLAYPALLSVLILFLLVLFGVRIVPAFEDVLPREKWTGTAAAMATVADFVNYGLLPTVLSIGVVIGVVVYSLPRWTGKWRVKADRFPPWSIYRLNMGAGFMLSVAALVKAGMKVPDILRILMRGAPPWYYERMSETLRHLNNGDNLGDALHRTKKQFPDEETVKDLRAYAAFNNFDETLELLGRQSVEESVEKISAQMSVFRNMALILLGLVFGLIATGIFALQGQVAAGL